MSSEATQHSPRTKITLIIAGLIALAVAVISCAALWGNPHQQPAASTETVSVDDDGLARAPEPEATFQDESCPAPEEQDPQLNPNEWAMPGLDAAAAFTPTQGTTVELPDAPDGIYYSPSMPVGHDQGATVLAGHVDYAPGALSDQGGELSPWGHLHEASACNVVYASDQDGQTHAYQVTDLYTVDQDHLPEDELFRASGDPALYLITCSGPSVQDAGGQFQFGYEHNLIIKAEPIN
ncbi:sortase [Rothia sp. AR01]|uniref:Sortase n=1 Tax=Rothia santali TaxID=2949643 RepID=A0A9X2HEM4_9MICC|nr:sortase [Rothia santali]MCP3425839.1 sortase [Rothia santali]